MKKSIITVFVVVCCFGLFPAAAFGAQSFDASRYLWRLVNEARVHPLRVIHAQGIDEDLARQALGDEASLLDTGLPPLAWNHTLALAAGGHNQEMVTRFYYSSIGLDGSLPPARVAAFGYQGCQVGELLGGMAFSVFMAPEEAARLIFAGWLQDELDPLIAGERHIFNRDFTEVGFSFKAAVLPSGEKFPPNVYVVVADFARPLRPRAYLLGHAFRDADGDGCFSPAEAVVGLNLWAWLPGGRDAAVHVATGPDGSYQLQVPWETPFNLALVDEWGSIVALRSFTGDDFPVGGDNRLLDWELTKD